MPDCLENQPDSIALALLPLRLQTATEADLPVTGLSMGSLTRNASHVRVQRLAGEPAFGDVILFRTQQQLVAHRVISIRRRDEQILTKGDACPTADPPVAKDTILGKVIGTLVHGQLTIPMRLRAPWCRILAINSRLQHQYRSRWPRLGRSLDPFRFLNRLLERSTQWKHIPSDPTY